ncbi:MAG TPA: dTDP-4-dehydrorhamnose reductase [Longimicrobium sp.]
MSAPAILLLGRGGQVGWELERALAPLGRVVAPPRSQVDLARPEQLRDAVRGCRPRLVVNAAAYTAVDRAEAEPEAAFAANATAPGVLAEEARRAGAFLVHYSTDYVFDGSKRAPYAEGDAPNPLNVYGRSKLEGERAVQAAGGDYLVLRTSWVYGARGSNFLRTVLRLLEERGELRVVADQEGAPTWSRLVAEATAAVVAQGRSLRPREAGVFHLSAAGSTSWHGFATAIQRALPAAQRAKRVAAIPSAEYPTPAARPAYSVLDNGRLRRAFGIALPEWDASLRLVLEELAAGRGGSGTATG